MANLVILTVLVEKILMNGFKAGIFLLNLSFDSLKNCVKSFIVGNKSKSVFVVVELCAVIETLDDYS